MIVISTKQQDDFSTLQTSWDGEYDSAHISENGDSLFLLSLEDWKVFEKLKLRTVEK